MVFRKFVCVLAVVALLLPAGFVFVRTTHATPTVIINELQWMGSPASSSDEWVELRNAGDFPVSIGGWKLKRLSSGSEVVMVTIPNGKVIEPHSFFLISHFAATSSSSQLNVTPDLVDSNV